MTISFTIKTEGVDGKLNLLCQRLSPVSLPLAIGKEMDSISANLTHYVRTRHLEGGTSSDRLRTRSRNLYNSAVPLPTTISGDVVVGGTSIGKDLAYTRVHIGNGTSTVIRAKGKSLTIPLGPALDSRGLAVKPASQYTNLKLIPKNGYALLAEVFPDGKILPYFLLKRQVTVPMRVHPEDILRENAPVIVSQLDTAINKWLSI